MKINFSGSRSVQSKPLIGTIHGQYQYFIQCILECKLKMLCGCGKCNSCLIEICKRNKLASCRGYFDGFIDFRLYNRLQIR